MNQLEFERQVYLALVRGADMRQHPPVATHNYAEAVARKAGEFYAKRVVERGGEASSEW